MSIIVCISLICYIVVGDNAKHTDSDTHFDLCELMTYSHIGNTGNTGNTLDKGTLHIMDTTHNLLRALCTLHALPAHCLQNILRETPQGVYHLYSGKRELDKNHIDIIKKLHRDITTQHDHLVVYILGHTHQYPAVVPDDIMKYVVRNSIQDIAMQDYQPSIVTEDRLAILSKKFSI